MGKNEPKPKGFFNRLWHFLWEEDSIWSWIANIILAFVLIKFVVYPLLGLMLGTSYPIVAVVSGSMEHDGNFDTWWESNAVCLSGACTQEEWYKEISINKEEFKKFPFSNGFNTGDIIILKGKDPKKVEVGDIIVWQSRSRPDPIIHRVIKKWWETDSYHFTTKGDHNQGIHLGIGEQDIPASSLVGKAWFRVPYLGWIKIGFSKLTGGLYQ